MRGWRWLRWTLVVLAVCAASVLGAARWKLGQSLPQIDGTLAARDSQLT